MRFQAVLLLAAFLGCDSTVTPADGGGGSGATSDGGTPHLGGSPSNGGFSQGGAPSTGGSGAGGRPMLNGCEQTCANVEGCFGVTCEQGGIDCGDPQAQCIGDCLKDASCQELGALLQGQPLPPEQQACVDACGGGQGGGGGGTQQGCGQCLFGNGCLGPCMNQPDCQAWGQCSFNCSTPDCYADCNTQHPEAAPYYTQIYQCACDNCSESTCSTTMDPCNQSGAGGAGTGGTGGG